jgi:dCMP deaminase
MFHLNDTEKWDRRFLELAALVATWSKDRSTQVGAVIVGPDREVRSTGYNGFPRDVDDEVEERHVNPEKYVWTEHAERNAIFNAARFGASTYKCLLYCTHPPCPDCARAVIQAGISEVVHGLPTGEFNERWLTVTEKARKMLQEAGVVIRSLDLNQEGRP